MANEKTIFGYLLLAGVATEILWRCYQWAKRRSTGFNCQDRPKPKISETESSNGSVPSPQDSQTVNSVTDVLFFPDKGIACKFFFVKPEGCNNEFCKFSHEKTSLSELYSHLNSAKTFIDVCVYTITCEDLVEILLDKKKKGILVRVITDDDQMKVSNAQIWKLREGGISVRTDNSSYFMHHKFVIVDKRMLLNGSFNWTRQAITGNQENLLITTESKLVTRYLEEFNRLWNQFDPKAIYSSELHSL